MKNNALFSVVLAVMLFYNQSSLAKNLSEIDYRTIDYRTVIPAYIAHSNMNMPLTDRVNERILARHLLATYVPEVSAGQYALNAKKALEHFTSHIFGIVQYSFTYDCCTALKIAIEKESVNTRNEVDKESYTQLLKEYDDFGPVPQEALEAIEQRILAFAMRSNR